jgi:hypothetical protein
MRGRGGAMLLGYTIAELACVCVFFSGRWLRNNPEKFSRLFPLGQRFARSYARIVGMFFVVMSVIGAVLYLVLAAVYVIKGR